MSDRPTHPRHLPRRLPALMGSVFQAGFLTVFLMGAGCGYTALRGDDQPPTRLFVVPVQSPSAALGGGPAAERAVSEAIARSPSFMPGTAGTDRSLEIRVVRASGALAPFAEPVVRAAHYQAEVSWTCVVKAPDGSTVWEGNVAGTASYLSTPGPLETLDGAQRRGVTQASRVAAERLLRRVRVQLNVNVNEPEPQPESDRGVAAPQ